MRCPFCRPLCNYERGKRPHAADCPNRPIVVSETCAACLGRKPARASCDVCEGRGTVNARRLARDVYETHGESIANGGGPAAIGEHYRSRASRPW